MSGYKRIEGPGRGVLGASAGLLGRVPQGLDRLVIALRADVLSLTHRQGRSARLDRLPQVPTTGGAPLGAQAGQIHLDTVHSPWIKDPSFVNGGNPVGGKRYIAFGDLRHFYLKPFEIAPTSKGGQGLAFGKGEIPIAISGLPAGVDGLWAPQIVVKGDQVDLFYTAGKMPPGQPIDWPTFRLHMASLPLAQFEDAAQQGRAITFQDRGPLFADQTTFGGSDTDFAMIDPDYYVNPQGQAFMTYTVVQPGRSGVEGQGARPWQEFVRSRQVSPEDPTLPIGPDQPMVDGWAGGLHDGVAEAQTVLTIGGRTMLLVSSHAGDKDQRVLAAPVASDLSGPLPDSVFRPVLMPGAAPWEANAVGSTDAMVLEGKAVLLYQGMSADQRFSLGWKTVALP